MSVILQTAQEKLASLRKPSLYLIDELKLTTNDWLIVCAGFEDRAIESLKKAAGASHSFNVMVILYEPYMPENKAHEIEELCEAAATTYLEVTYDRRNPLAFGENLLQLLTNCYGRIFIDVSAMSRLLIIQTIVALAGRAEQLCNCLVVYTEAKTYPPSQEQAESELEKSEKDPTMSVLFLSSGVFEITVVPELSSLAPAASQTRLIVFPSLDSHQLIALRNELQPSRFTFIEGQPPSINMQWRAEIVSRINQLETIRNAERYTTSTLDYTETLDCLLSIYSQHSIQERLIISPTGSKMQTVGVAIFRSFIEDVQIVYPTPQDFCTPDGYTIGVGCTYVLPLDPYKID